MFGLWIERSAHFTTHDNLFTVNDSVRHVPTNNGPSFTVILWNFVEYGIHTQYTVHATVTMQNVMACAILMISMIPPTDCLQSS
jgi:hypothetical protein